MLPGATDIRNTNCRQMCVNRLIVTTACVCVSVWFLDSITLLVHGCILSSITDYYTW